MNVIDNRVDELHSSSTAWSDPYLYGGSAGPGLVQIALPGLLEACDSSTASVHSCQRLLANRTGLWHEPIAR